MATPKSMSTIKSFRILRAFRRPGEALSNAQLSRRTGLPASSVRRLLHTLLEAGAVRRTGPTCFSLGPQLYSFGQVVDRPDCLRRAATAPLAELYRRFDLPVAMATLNGYMAHYLTVLAPSKLRQLKQGAHYEAYSSAIGRVLLAEMSDEHRERFLGCGALVALTPFTIVTPASFVAELTRIRQQGFAVEREETSLGIGSVAVPLRDHCGRVYAAISASDAIYTLSQARIVLLQEALLATANQISRVLFPIIRVLKVPSPTLCPTEGAGMGATSAPPFMAAE